MSRQIDREILLGFVEEAEGYLAPMRQGLQDFRENPTNSAILEEAHRCVHTIKGAAAMVGLTGLSHIAFHLEEAVEELMHGMLDSNPATYTVLNQNVDRIETYLQGVKNDTLVEGDLVDAAKAELLQLIGRNSEESLPKISSDFFTDTPLDLTDSLLSGGLIDPPPFQSPQTIAEPEPLPIPDFASFLRPVASLEQPSSVSPPAKPAKDIADELLEVFRLEAEDHLRVLTTQLPAARKDPKDLERWQEIRRAAHTLKGAAAMVGFQQVTQLAHRMEDLLEGYYDQQRVATIEEIDLLLSCTDWIEDTVSSRPTNSTFDALNAKFATLVAKEETAPVAPVSKAEVEVADTAEATTAKRDASDSYVRVPIEKLNDIVKLVGELVIARTGFEQKLGFFSRLLSELEPSTHRLRRASTRLETGYEASALLTGRTGSTGRPAIPGEGLPPFEADEPAEHQEGFDELELDRYTEFHVISRELAETTNDIQTIGGELNYIHGDFDGHLTRQARLTSELEDKLMRLRMVPLHTFTSKLQRTVRNAAEQTGKKVELQIEGEQTGLDKTVLDAMNDPLLHLLRNAVDHGIETPEVRLALGKSEHGNIRLRAGHEGSQVVLVISDDGRGIDVDKLRDTLVDRGLTSIETAKSLSNDDVFNYLFSFGFSTKNQITELSGRGVGLDVVKSKVESLKGTVTITSQVGKGTTFTIRLPMTLAVTKALLLKANQQMFALPLDSIEQIQRLEDQDIEHLGKDPLLRVGDHIYPVVTLSRLLNLRHQADESVKRPPVVLIRSGEKRIAIVVDYLLGGREVVIKNLGSHLKRVPGVSGATLMGDGSVVLILNPAELIRTSLNVLANRSTPKRVEERAKQGTSVLIVDDSPSVRRVLATLAERAGWQAVTAKDGLEALENLQKGTFHPDIVLTDVEMPRMDGYELLSTIRGMAAVSTLPVVMITSRSAEKHRRKAMELGASAYVTKPYQDESLLEIVKQLTRNLHN